MSNSRAIIEFVSKQMYPSEVFPSFFLKRWYIIALFFMLVFAGGIRLYKLDQVPAGMTWDEAAIGYNGYAIVHARRDERLQKLPISFRSFGDYKAPLAIYINGISTTLFGLNIGAVRLPFALAGVMTVVGVVLLIRELTDNKLLSLFAGFFITTSSWHIHFSRAGFESGIALCGIIWGIFFFFRFFTVGEKRYLNYGFLFLAVFSLVASMYTYHSAKIVAPLLAFVVLLLHKKSLHTVWKPIVVSAFFAVLLLQPLLRDSLQGKGAERLQQTSLFSTSMEFSLAQKMMVIANNFITHLSPSFLFLGETTTLRHGDGQWGVLFITEVFLGLITCLSVFLLFLNRKGIIQFNFLDLKALHINRRLFVLAVLWIVIGLLPATIGFEVPHANRALLAYPGFIILEILGIKILFDMVSQAYSVNLKNILRIVIGMMVLIHALLFLSYQADYFTNYSQRSSSDFYYGYHQAFEFAIKQEDTVDRILFTSHYGQPYIYALFFRQTNPIWYQGGSLIKYEFTDRISVGDLSRNNVVIVATPDEIDPSLADQLVIAPDGSIKFVLIKTK